MSSNNPIIHGLRQVLSNNSSIFNFSLLYTAQCATRSNICKHKQQIIHEYLASLPLFCKLHTSSDMGKTPKKRKIRKIKKSYNFLKIVAIVVDFFHMLWNLILDEELIFWGLCQASFCLQKLFCVSETILSKKRGKKVVTFKITFQK